MFKIQIFRYSNVGSECRHNQNNEILKHIHHVQIIKNVDEFKM